MELYARPANRFVAGFIGSPAMNFVDGTFRSNDAGSSGERKVTFTGEGISVDVGADAPSGNRVVLGIRPQHLEVVADGEGTIRAEVAIVEPMGNEQIVYTTLPGGKRLVAVAPPEPAITPGAVVDMKVKGDAVHLFDAETGARLSIARHQAARAGS
jgi:multiple sugar transport system ATP-binding protein